MALKKIVFILFAIAFLQGCVSNTTQPPSDTQTNSDMLGGNGLLEIKTQNVTYFENSNGFLAAPKNGNNFPGVILIHEWWGLNQNIKDMAAELAKNGYAVLAVDLYEGKVAATPEEARTLVSGVQKDRALQNMRAAIAYLELNNSVQKIASLGWCFGGGQSLQLAISDQPKVDATILYYGTPLVTDQAQLSKIKWPILGIFGDKDMAIPVDSVKEFDAKLDELGIENEVYIYQGVGHAFANPSGQNYAAEETKDAWQKTLSFLQKNLKNN